MRDLFGSDDEGEKPPPAAAPMVITLDEEYCPENNWQVPDVDQEWQQAHSRKVARMTTDEKIIEAMTQFEQKYPGKNKK